MSRYGCRITTQTGQRCSRKATANDMCTQHGQMHQHLQRGGAASPEKIMARYGDALLARLSEDPSYDKSPPLTNFIASDYKSKYLEWIVTSYIGGGIRRHEDLLSRVRPALASYNKLVKAHKLSPGDSLDPLTNEANILNFCGLSGCKVKGRELPGLDGLLSKYIKDVEPVVAKKFDALYYGGTTVNIYQPKTEEESCHYGRGTKWCTAATKGNNKFSHYNSQGPLYIIVPKVPTYKGEKYQIHKESESYMDEMDQEVSLHPFLLKYPEVNRVLFPEFKVWDSVDDLPVITGPNSVNVWYIDGRLYRYKDRYQDKFYKNGAIHRIDIPTIRTWDDNGTQLSEEWFVDWKRHRLDGPAKQTWNADGKKLSEEWFVSGGVHRTDGPALQLWDDDGVKLSEKWYVDNVPHRTDGPASQNWYDNHTKEDERWYMQGKLHRTDGPAVQLWYENGMRRYQGWYRNGKHYREDGPVEQSWYSDGRPA